MPDYQDGRVKPDKRKGAARHASRAATSYDNMNEIRSRAHGYRERLGATRRKIIELKRDARRTDKVG